MSDLMNSIRERHAPEDGDTQCALCQLGVCDAAALLAEVERLREALELVTSREYFVEAAVRALAWDALRGEKDHE